MADRLTMTIEHARLNHRRVECGPGIPGCGPECEGCPDGKPEAFCSTCGVWPCSVSILLGEVDRLAALAGEAADVIKAYEERDYAEGRGKPEKLRAAIGKGPEL